MAEARTRAVPGRPEEGPPLRARLRCGTDTEFLIVEIKADREMDDPDVLAKARAARRWCEFATEQAKEAAAKPWRYALVPASAVTGGATLLGLLGEFG